MEDTEEEWELCNDDGFIYKRKKRRMTEYTSSTATTKASGAVTDPEAEERNRRKRKRKTLLKVKKQYQNEIHHWELLSNTLLAMQQKSLQFQHPQQQQEKEEVSVPEIDETPSFLSCGSLVDDLLLQAEAQEEIIRDVSNLCDVAEGMCSAQEEQLKQSYFDLPIWASPRDLMASLCDDKEVLILGSLFHPFYHLIS